MPSLPGWHSYDTIEASSLASGLRRRLVVVPLYSVATAH